MAAKATTISLVSSLATTCRRLQVVQNQILRVGIGAFRQAFDMQSKNPSQVLVWRLAQFEYSAFVLIKQELKAEGQLEKAELA